MSLQTGQVLQNRYRIVKLLGQGGFGAVYRAWDKSLERACAVKENLDITHAAQSQFEREARLLARLRHPNLPQIYDHFFLLGQGQYLVMEFVEGQSLQEMLDRGGAGQTQGGQPQGLLLPEGQVLTWIGQVAEALGYMHHQSPPVIHRDVKPANIVVNSKGEAMLVDFGIAKAYDPNVKTTQGARAVTPGYSPHEQYGQGTTDARSDVYALGATLYTLLTRQVPGESIQRMLRDPLMPPHQINPAISIETSALIMKAMSNDPDNRYADGSAFKAALQAKALQAPTVLMPLPQPITAPASAPSVVQPGGMQRPALLYWIGGALGLIVLAVVLIWSWNNFAVNLPASPDLNLRDTATAGVIAMQHTLTALARAAAPSLEPATLTSLPPTSTFTPTRLQSSATFTSIPPTPILTLVIGSTMGWEVDGMTLMYVPAGQFLMGSNPGDAGSSSNEYPQRAVILNAFWIDKYEVTNAQYALCVAAGACQPPSKMESNKSGSYYDNLQYGGFPVIYVSWNDAHNYCTWAGRRLLTEAEWEKAARGPDRRIYPWGNLDTTCDLLNFKVNGACVGDPTAMGSYPSGAGPYGALDMAGNVWEWVADWYAENYYQTAPNENPPGPASGEYRVMRGGAWDGNGYDVRAAYRSYGDLQYRSDRVGFRCAASP